MAQFNGFRCDSCGGVIAPEQRTKKTTKFEGYRTNGEFSEDLCPDCVAVPPDVELKPLRRRRKTAEVAA